MTPRPHIPHPELALVEPTPRKEGPLVVLLWPVVVTWPKIRS